MCSLKSQLSKTAKMKLLSFIHSFALFKFVHDDPNMNANYRCTYTISIAYLVINSFAQSMTLQGTHPVYFIALHDVAGLVALHDHDFFCEF